MLDAVTHTSDTKKKAGQAMSSPDDPRHNCCPLCGGHCNVHAKGAGYCMQRPGRQGASCNALSSWQVNGSIAKMMARLPNRQRNERGEGALLCRSRNSTFEVQQLRLSNWVRATDRMPRANAACPGCRAAQQCCSGRGTCLNGWCSCDSGIFGLDCAHSDRGTPTSGGGHRRRRGVAIYVYEMPPDLGFNYGRSRNNIYSAEFHFVDTLLADATTRTLDPSEADLFLIPFWSNYGPAENTHCDRSRLQLAIDVVRNLYPFWDRSGGRDHVLFLTGDRGACGVQKRSMFINHPRDEHRSAGQSTRRMQQARPPSPTTSHLRSYILPCQSYSDHLTSYILQARPPPPVIFHRHLNPASSILAQPPPPVIFVSHFGLLGPFSLMGDVSNDRPAADLASGSVGAITKAADHGSWCYAPHKDVVVPPYMPTRNPDGTPPVTSSSRAAQPTGRRTHLLIHAGGIGGWNNGDGVRGKKRWGYYSMGMRQRLWQRWGGGRGLEARLRILNRSVGVQRYNDLMRSSEFCLAPNGNGWGYRLSETIAAGCVPLIVQPLVHQPFEDVLPYFRFSARLTDTAAAMDDGLPARLANLSAGRRGEGLRRRLGEVRRAFVWGTAGLAYNFTVLALCHRAWELRGHLKAGAGVTCAELAAALPGGATAERATPSWYPPSLTTAMATLQAARRMDLQNDRQESV